MKYKLFAGLVLLVPVLVFVQQNIDPVNVRFISWERPVSLSLLLLATLLAGVVLGVLTSFFRKRKKDRKLKQAELKKQQEKPSPPAQEPVGGTEEAESTRIFNVTEQTPTAKRDEPL